MKYVDGRLIVPPIPARHLSRPRLLELIDAAAARPVTLVAAGPGAGKSVLLADWARHRQPRPAWITLEHEHNRPGAFWASLAESLRVAGYSRSPLDGPLPYEAESILAPVVAGAGGQPIEIVLDDVHVLEERGVLDALDECVRAWGRQLRFVLAARSDPLLPLHRYRLAGDLAEIRGAELRMTRDEAQSLLSSFSVRLQSEEFETLYRRTEGWAAGLRLSAMRMEGAPDPGEFVTTLALDPGSVGEYLIEEVLNRQPAAVKQLLIDTSFLDTVTVQLAEATTGDKRAGELLAELARSNAFVVPMDAAGRAYRYHQLFREVLRYLLRREGHEHQRAVLRRAARLCGSTGILDEAIRHSVAGEDWTYLAELIANGGLARAMAERIDLGDFGIEALLGASWTEPSEQANLLVASAALLAWRAQSGEADRVLDDLSAVIGSVTGPPAVTTELSSLLIARERRDTLAARAAAANVLRSGSITERAVARFELAMALFYSGEHADVAGLLEAGRDEARKAGLASLELRFLAQLAHVLAFWGRITESSRHDRQAALRLHQLGNAAPPLALSLGRALRALARANVAEGLAALELCERTDRLRPREDDVYAEVAMTRVLLLVSGGRLEEARRAVVAFEPATRGLIGGYQQFAAAAVETASGRTARALRLVRSASAPPPEPLASLAIGRALLVNGDLDQAAVALADAATVGPAAFYGAIHLDALFAGALVAKSRGVGEDAAVSALVAGIRRSDTAFVLPFVYANEAFAELRERYPDLDAQWPVRTDLRVVAGAPSDDSTGPVGEPLTDREQAVLRWLATSMSVLEIANELCLSLNTVKTHIASIYRKLGMPSRQAAVARGRTLELL